MTTPTPTPFRILNSIVYQFPGTNGTIVASNRMYQRSYPNADITDFPVISLGTRILDSRLLSCLMGSLSYNDLLDWNTGKMVQLFP